MKDLTEESDEEEFDPRDERYLEKITSKNIASLDELTDNQRQKRKEDDGLKLVETVFDNKTRLILFSMINKGYFNILEGAISTGKEANVYFATTNEQSIAIKIFRIDAPSFKKMRPYVEGDYRFRRFKSSRSGFIEIWAKKEFKNLKRMVEHNLPVPNPIYVERNILLMEFLGDQDSVLPRLKDSEPKNPSSLYKRVMESVKTIYRKCKLVHADLSEYNILYNANSDDFYIIDVSQAVLHSHPNADRFLVRDLSNLNRYFQQYKVKVVNLPKLFKWVTGTKLDETLLIE
ncbi:MAG: serine protein kinase RIO [Candidatus Heimdallarchaeota archaeon]|nr:serine protein kinase RIO [Candidatus Heimdallarchaeota archaeon]